ncbi:MAG: ribosome biogenesis GTPase Der [Phycisphaerae bacterium]|nr:ribosome biogenesis GTPase Der [Phycisphaerae bacterium]
MPLPIVAIVGRPNVGKSSLFNALARERISIVEATPGVTRDRVSTLCEYDGLFFELVDTGGHGIVDRDDLEEHVERQIQYAIQQADLILLVVDAREGLNPLDRETAALLRDRTDRVMLVANKVDEPHMEALTGEFIRLGLGEPIPVSAMNGLGRRELAERVLARVREHAQQTPPDPVMKVALVGKRNAGKSSFLNALAGEPRVIVSEKPGTTRDSVDVRFERDGRTIVAIDTAGVRKKSKLDDIEYYAYDRAVQAIGRADVILFLIDSTEPVGRVDKRLSQLISEQYKPCILVVNKWDLARGKAQTGDYGDYLAEVMPELDHAPVSFTSALHGRNIQSTLDLATELLKQADDRVSTGRLNQMLSEALSANTPKSKRGRKPPRFYYATQVATRPPTIVLFVNDPSRVTQDYERFLLNRFREQVPFGEVPIRLLFRARTSRGEAPGHRTKPAHETAEVGDDHDEY